jgi:uncharacterized DUF497 family protein
MINAEVTGFDWDEQNTDKNRNKHGVEAMECEEVFFHQPLVVTFDTMHSQDEQRFHALGQTDKARLLLLVYTIRSQKIRVISARDMSRKERKIYESHHNATT